MPFIDAHMHFWDREILKPYIWMHEVPTIWHRHTFENLPQETDELPDKVVFIEAGAPWREELQWVEQLAASEPRIAALVPRLIVNAGAQTTADIAELRRHPLVRGVRHHFEHDPVDYCSRPEFMAGVRQLASAGLTFDICCRPGQLPAVIDLVRACPEVTFILDHAGKAPIRDRQIDPWRSQMSTLAAYPNLVCKFSGLAVAGGPEWTISDLRPWVAHLLDTFTPSRLLFGGDWPICKLATSYTRWLQTVRELTAALSASERKAIFQQNAARIYRL